jgi:hypothetical protein
MNTVNHDNNNININNNNINDFNHFNVDDSFGCLNNFCENVNRCEYFENVNFNQQNEFHQYQQQQQPQFVNNGFYQYGGNNNNNSNNNNFGDRVVPSVNYNNNIRNGNFMNYQTPQHQIQQHQQQQFPTSFQSTNAYYNNNNGSATNLSICGNNYNPEIMQTHPPCKGPQPWNFAHCYGYFDGDAPCQFANVIDMEDFM